MKASSGQIVGLLAAAALAFGLTLARVRPAAAQTMEIRSLVTDAEGKPVPEAVVFLYQSKLQYPPPQEPYRMDQVNKEFFPHILPILAGGRVRFPNKDNIHHHLYSFSPAKSFELPLYKGEPAKPLAFPKTGVIKLGCNIHDWMSGYILVLPTPHYAVTDAEGRARLTVPIEPELELAVFHERLQDSVESTRRTIEPAGEGSLEERWQIPLRPRKKRRRVEAAYP